MSPEEQERKEHAVRMSESDFVEYVTSKAVEKIEERNRQRSLSRTRYITIAISALALIGVGSIAAIFNAVVSINVESALEGATSELKEDLQREIAYQQFFSVAMSIAEEERKLARSDRDAAMDLLRGIADAEQIVQRSAFAMSLERILKKFFAAHLTNEIDEVESMLEDCICSHPASIAILCNHYGQEVIGSRYPLERQPEMNVARFRRYVEAAGRNQYPELELLYNLLREFKENGLAPSKLTDDLVQSVPHLNTVDGRNFRRILRDYCDPKEWMRQPNEQGECIATVARAVVAAYPFLIEPSESDLDSEE